MIKTVTVALLLIICRGGGLYSQQSSVVDEQLNKYLLIALKNNPAIRQKMEIYNSSMQESVVAGVLPDPSIEVGVLPEPLMLPGGSQRANIRAMQMVPWFGSLRAAREEKISMAAALNEQTREAASSVLYSVEEKYLRIGALEKEVEALNQSSRILETLRQLAVTRMENGSVSGTSGSASMSNSASAGTSSGSAGMNMGSRQAQGQEPKAPMGGAMNSSSSGSLADVYRLDMEIASVQNRIKILGKNRKTLVAEMNSLLNRPLEEDIVVGDISLIASLTDITILISDVVKNNPMASMAREEEMAARSAYKMADLMRYPMIGFGVEYMIMGQNSDVMSGMNGRDMIMPMVSATIPLWSKKNKASVKMAEYKTDAAGSFIEATENSVSAAVVMQTNEYRNALDNIALYSSQSVLSERIIDLYIIGFSSGSRSLEDLLRVWQENLNFSIQKANAEADAGVALAGLKMLNGYFNIMGAVLNETADRN